MPRLDHTSTHFFQTLSQQLRQEHLSPDQVASISKAVSKLPASAHLTHSEVDALADGLGMTQQHKATLIFALLMHKYGADLKPLLADPNAMANGLAGMIDTLILNHTHHPLASERMHAFFAGYQSPRAAAEESGLEIFRNTAPGVKLDPEGIHVEIASNYLPMLDTAWVKSIGFTDEQIAPNHQRYATNVALGSFVEAGEGGWVFQPEPQNEALDVADVPLGQIGIQALELLSQGLSAYINQRSHGQNANDPKAALAVAKDIGQANELLVAVMEMIERKNDHHTSLLRETETQLRTNLKEFRVARIGAEAANALVAALLPKEKKV